MQENQELPLSIPEPTIAVVQTRAGTEKASQMDVEPTLFSGDHSPPLIARVDTQYRFLSTSRGFAARFGLTPQEAVGKPIHEALGEAAFRTLLPYLERAFSGEEVAALADLTFPDLGLRSLRLYLTPEFSGEESVVAVVHDMTPLRAMEAFQKSEELYRTLAEAVPAFVWSCGPKGEPIFVSQRWIDYTGLTLEQAVHVPMNVLHHPEDVPRLAKAWQEALVAREPYEAEFRFRRHDGVYRWFLARAIPIKDGQGQIRQWVGTTTDIHERKQAEETIKQHLKEIESLNFRLQNAMMETHHRIRNSLQILAALMDIHALTSDGMVPASEFARCLQCIRIFAVIHDLLTRQAKEDGTAQSIPVKSLLENLLPLLQQVAGTRRLRSVVDEAALPIRSATALAIVTNELVTNALLYGGNEIEVSFRVEEASATLEVCDDGPGYPADFDPNRAATFGVELVTNLVRWDLSGQITYGNRPEGGARVAVTFAHSA